MKPTCKLAAWCGHIGLNLKIVASNPDRENGGLMHSDPYLKVIEYNKNSRSTSGNGCVPTYQPGGHGLESRGFFFFHNPFKLSFILMLRVHKKFPQGSASLHTI